MIGADVAYAKARAGDADGARTAYEAAFDALSRVDKSALGATDAQYQRAAVRIAAARWAGEPQGTRGPIAIRTGAPGETCLDAGSFERCSYAQVWGASARVSPKGDQVAISVEPVAGWLELWVLSKDGDGWRVDTLVPAAIEPGLGYVELAGWSPDGRSILIAREAQTDAGIVRQLAVLDAKRLTVVKSAKNAGSLAAFGRWAFDDWKRNSLALR